MKKIAYICKSFAPVNNIAAIRHSKFVKYMVKYGWDVTVFTEEISSQQVIDPNLICEEHEKAHIIRFHKKGKNDSNHVINNNHTKEQIKSFKIFNKLYNFSKIFVKDLEYFFYFKNFLKKTNLNLNFDVIISSYQPFYIHWSAYCLLKRQKIKKCIWIADFRDLPNDTPNIPFFAQPINNIIQTFICKKANAVITVSQGLRERLLRQILGTKNSEKFYVITNGFDDEDVDLLQEYYSQNNYLKICYTGQIRKGKRDASLLFDAISELICEKKISFDCMEVIFAGLQDSYNLFLSQAKKYNLERIINYLGYLEHSEILRIQKKCDLLLLLTSNNKTEYGILTGKFFEYMGINKPILALITGNMRGSELSKIIEDENLGSSYYYLDVPISKEKLKNILVNYYNQKKQLGEIPFSPSLSIKNYSYRKTTEKLINIIESQ